jgi:hypothetical protein
MATKEINVYDSLQVESGSSEEREDHRITRNKLSKMLTAEDIHRSMLENVFNLSIPWSSKESILFTCVDDISLISTTLAKWKGNEKISVEEFDFLEQRMKEKKNSI